MRLLNLLTVGNSFSSIEDHPSRYKMRRENLLPHFGDAEPADAARDSNRSILNLPAPSAAACGPLRAQDLFPSKARSGALPMSKSKTVAEARPPASCADPAGRWFVKHALSPSQDSAVRPEAVPVQRNLPWEDFPVARNDLSEADVEVVPVPRKPEPARAPASPRTAPTSSGSLLGRMKARWFRGARK